MEDLNCNNNKNYFFVSFLYFNSKINPRNQMLTIKELPWSQRNFRSSSAAWVFTTTLFIYERRKMTKIIFTRGWLRYLYSICFCSMKMVNRKGQFGWIQHLTMVSLNMCSGRISFFKAGVIFDKISMLALPSSPENAK